MTRADLIFFTERDRRRFKAYPRVLLRVLVRVEKLLVQCHPFALEIEMEENK